MALLSSPWQTLASTPPATRAFTIALLAFSALHLYISWTWKPPHAYLTLLPGVSYYYPWTLITSSFVELTVPELIASLLFLPPSLRYLERLWGTYETAKFIFITLSISNLVAMVLSWIEFFVIGNADFFLYGPSANYHGQMALQAAVLVAFTQIIPEHQVQILGVLKLRVKGIPMIYVTFSTILTLLGYPCPFILIQFGWLVSWFYLRFYKRTPGEDTWGDRSETFAFVIWFPPFLHGPIGFASKVVYELALKLKLVRPSPYAELDATGGMIGGPGYAGGARAEAERRRALALKALDQRMATASPALSPIPQSAAGPSSSLPASAPSTAPAETEGKGKAREQPN